MFGAGAVDALKELEIKIFSRKTNPEKVLIQKMALLMMELNISYKDLMDMPIPAFIHLSNALEEIKKREHKADNRRAK